MHGPIKGEPIHKVLLPGIAFTTQRNCNTDYIGSTCLFVPALDVYLISIHTGVLLIPNYQAIFWHSVLRELVYLSVPVTVPGSCLERA